MRNLRSLVYKSEREDNLSTQQPEKTTVCQPNSRKRRQVVNSSTRKTNIKLSIPVQWMLLHNSPFNIKLEVHMWTICMIYVSKDKKRNQLHYRLISKNTIYIMDIVCKLLLKYLHDRCWQITNRAVVLAVDQNNTKMLSQAINSITLLLKQKIKKHGRLINHIRN